MVDSFVSFIKFSHLSALGLQKEHVYFILILLGIIVCYFIVQPVMQWFITLRSVRLLSYLISSLLVICIFFIIAIYVPELTELLFPLLELMLQVLALFGMILIIYYGVRRMIGKT